MQVEEFAKFSGLNKKRYDFTKFTGLNSSTNRRAATQPMVTISSKALYLNMAFYKKYQQFKYVTVGYYDNQLLLTFYRENAPIESIKLTTQSAGGFQIGFSKMWRSLSGQTDAVNLDVFKYKYKVTMLDDNFHAIIDLREPFSKTKQKEKK